MRVFLCAVLLAIVAAMPAAVNAQPQPKIGVVLMFGALPANPLTRLYEPNAEHLQAPSAAGDEMMRWMRDVAGR